MMCSECLEHLRNKERKKRESGLCQCGAISHSGMCDSCKEKHKLRAKDKASLRRNDGKCYACGLKEPLSPTNGRCADCTNSRRSRYKRLYHEYKSKGLCVWCGEEQCGQCVLCRECWFKQSAKGNLGAVAHANKLKHIWEKQDGRCAYTGIRLEPGLTASIDHIIPTSRGGTDDESNLQWVCDRVNIMKNNLNHEEFVTACKVIVAYTESREEPLQAAFPHVFRMCGKQKKNAVLA